MLCPHALDAYRVLGQQTLTQRACSAGRLGQRPEAGAGAQAVRQRRCVLRAVGGRQVRGPRALPLAQRQRVQRRVARRLHARPGHAALEPWRAPRPGEPAPGHGRGRSAAACCVATLTPTSADQFWQVYVGGVLLLRHLHGTREDHRTIMRGVPQNLHARAALRLS